MKATPLVTLAGAVTLKCVALCARLVSEKVVVKEPFAALTLYEPAVALALKTGETATPLPSVITLAVVVPLLNVPEAPDAGAVNVTLTPGTGLLNASRIVTVGALAKAVLMAVLCGVVPALAVIDAAGHLPNLERPTAFNDALQTFLSTINC